MNCSNKNVYMHSELRKNSFHVSTLLTERCGKNGNLFSLLEVLGRYIITDANYVFYILRK